MDLSTSSTDLLGVPESSFGGPELRGRRLWSELPEEIVHLILKALPPAAHCEFRCVCKSWKRFLSSSPDWMYWTRTGTPCSIVTTVGDSDVRILCHSDEKCLSLPFNPMLRKELSVMLVPCPSREWHLVDVDEGLFCYHANVGGECNLTVCNPLTQCYQGACPRTLELFGFKLKLLVDRKLRTFKIVYLDQGLPATWLFDSFTSRWTLFDTAFPDGATDLFVWKGVVHAYSKKSTKSDCLCSFDIKSGEWKKITARLPGGKGDRYIVSDKRQVLLVRSYPGSRFCLAVWKLRENGKSEEPDFSLSMWENLRVWRQSPIPAVSTACLIRVSLGAGFVCFMFRGSVESAVAQGRTSREICLKYSFVTGSVSVLARSLGCGAIESVFPWEANLAKRFPGDDDEDEYEDDDDDYVHAV